jgi:predicted phosphodiesterase
MTVAARRRALHLLVLVLVAAAAGLATLSMSSQASGRVGPGRVVVDAHLRPDGRTAVELPPLGRVTAATPGAPVALRARVDEVDVEALQRLLTADDPQARLTDEIRDDLPDLLRWMALRTLALAALPGALVVLVLPGRRWWHAAVGAVASPVAVALVGLVAWHAFDVDAFRQPTFEGALERAPGIVEAAQRHVDDLAGVRDRVRVLGTQLADLYAESGAVDLGGSDAAEVRLLHVSDIHSNPLGLELVQRLARSFDVDAVLDTGDITSFGFPLEARLGEMVADVPVPYLLVPGNHDSDANRAALAAEPNVQILDGTTTSVRGVRILGIADPTFTATNETSTAEAKRAKEAAAPAVRRAVRRTRPDVLAVHDRALAGRSFGVVPLIVSGHVHHRDRQERDGTLALTVGSTGAGGLGSFTIDTGNDYEAEVLRFRGHRLVGVDYVALKGVSGDFTIDRTVIDEPEP